MVGEVHASGIYKYYHGRTLREYISIAGGLTVDAEKDGIWVTYPDGTSKQLKRLKITNGLSVSLPWPSPKVYDGSVISVGLKENIEPFDATEYAKEVTTILANLAQVLLLYAAVK